MADGDQAPAPAAGTPQEPVAAASPAVAAPAVAPEPVVAPEPAPAPIADPVAAPAVEEPAAPAAPAAEPTLLQKHDAEVAAAAKPAADAPAAAAAKPAEPAKPADPAAAAADPAAAPAEPVVAAAPDPVEYKYELPETISMDDATRGSFHTALDAFRADPAAGAQGLIDLHNQTMQQYADHVAQEQQRVWNETRKGWQTSVMADEQLGGAGFQTSMGAIARMRDLLVAEPNRAAFDEFLSVTGAGDHPEFLRILHNAARIYDEAPMAPPGARPTATNGQAPVRGLRGLYKSNNGAGRP